MIEKAWSLTTYLHTTPKPECESPNGLRDIIVEMREFEEEQELDDFTSRQLKSLIALVEDLTKLDQSTPADKRFEWIWSLRGYNLWFPLNSLLAGKNHSSTLMINAYLYKIALYSSGQTSQPFMTDLGVDLPSLLEKTLQKIRSS
jgi:hypothetical protein